MSLYQNCDDDSCSQQQQQEGLLLMVCGPAVLTWTLHVFALAGGSQHQDE